jgi:D-3-phosphoglycerate dehydrogenase
MGNNRSVDSMDQVLAESDYVTLHVPATNLTEGMIGAEELAKMKAGAYLLNASRGSVVDLDALADAIRGEHLAGAAIDVYPSEPRTKKSNEFESPLIGLPNVFLTPHIGGSTEEAQEAIGLEVSATLTRFVNQGSTAGAVNFPNIDLPMTEGTHRILNAHRNVPGVMRDISRILSESNANIHAQQLATDANVGYLITDLDQGMSVDVKQAIAALETSIKTRILY